MIAVSKNKKDSYKDLEKNREEVLYNKTKWAKRRAEQEAKIPQWLKDAFKPLEADYKRVERLNFWLETRYCTRNNLTEKQMNSLIKGEMSEKIEHNGRLFASSFNHSEEISSDERLQQPEKTGISYFESGCEVWETEISTWICDWFGCKKQTNLVVLVFGVDHKALCLEHWEELKRILKEKPKDQW